MTATITALTVDEVIDRAATLIRERGFWQQGFGNHSIGFSVEGAIYQALGLREDDLNLVDDPSQCDKKRWDLAATVFTAVAEQLNEPTPSSVYSKVCNWSETGTRAAALVLLDRTAAMWHANQRQAAA